MKDGSYKSWYESGKPESEQFFKDDLSHGKQIGWSDDDKQVIQGEGEFYMGTGKYTSYLGKVQCYSVTNYRDGVKNGEEKKVYFDGSPWNVGNYISGTGSYKCFYYNGKLSEEGLIVDETLNGEWKAYYKTGEVKGKATFSGGTGKVTYYYKNGKLLFEGLLEDGIFIGKGRWYYPSGVLKGEFNFNSEGEIDENTYKNYGLVVPTFQMGHLFTLESSIIEYIKLIYDGKITVTKNILDELSFYKIVLEDDKIEYDQIGQCMGGWGALLAKSSVENLIKKIDEILIKNK